MRLNKLTTASACCLAITLGAATLDHPVECKRVWVNLQEQSHHYTQATIDGWAQWRKEWQRRHPGRPLPPTQASLRKSRMEALKAFDFACGPLELESEDLTALLPTPDGPPILALLDNTGEDASSEGPAGPPLLTGPIDTATNEGGYPLGNPVIFGGGCCGGGGGGGTPVVPSVPEPTSLLLLGTGLLVLARRLR